MTIRNAKNFKNNQQKGKDLEKRFMEYLSRRGFWVHFMHPAPDGSQPFDIIACKGASSSGLVTVCAFDCKTLEENRFPLSRVEDNQRTAFQLLNRKGIHNTYFVIEFMENIVSIIPSQDIERAIRDGEKSIKMGGQYCAYIGDEQTVC